MIFVIISDEKKVVNTEDTQYTCKLKYSTTMYLASFFQPFLSLMQMIFVFTLSFTALNIPQPVSVYPPPLISFGHVWTVLD